VTRGETRILRDVVAADIAVFLEHQRDPEASRMAAFPARDEEAFTAHWRRILANEAVTKRTILCNGEVAGNIVSFDGDGGKRFVGYWIGREFWGQGLATRALAELLGELALRPLHAYVAKTNVGSIRVLEKCGFVPVGSTIEFDEALGEELEELLMELR
jgi:RimJ/RimL family protein N-acetyltransferase